MRSKEMDAYNVFSNREVIELLTWLGYTVKEETTERWRSCYHNSSEKHVYWLHGLQR